MGDNTKAHEWFSLVVSPQGRPTDPGALARIAGLYAKQEDDLQSYHYHLESYRYWPVDLNVITWLGIYYVKQELYEQAIPYFARAAEIVPKEAKWLLMVASCHRRMGNLPQALSMYETVHKLFPYDQECLRYLITICKELDVKHTHYDVALRKLERMEEAREAQLAEQGEGPDYGMAGMGMMDPSMPPDSMSMFVPQEPQFSPPAGFEQPSAQQGDELPVPAQKTGKKMLKKPKAVEEDDDMDWGDADLLPDF
jgi:tetratricopeptide (TPR) repeat protein